VIASLVLYGSRARGDHRLSSDVDLIGITDGGLITRESPSRGANLHLYPFSKIIIDAGRGDLFVLHLVAEGKPLHDTLGVFERVKDAFCYRADYSDTIETATAVGLFLLSSSIALSKKSGRRRFIWALRTILIATAAQEENPIFSSGALEDFSGIIGLKKLIDRRYTTPISDLKSIGEHLIDRYGTKSVIENWPFGKVAQRNFVQKYGPIGVSTASLASFRFKVKRVTRPDSVVTGELIYE
jgi:predicted nucleotidyltransferase